jgi:hypothetical protein
VSPHSPQAPYWESLSPRPIIPKFRGLAVHITRSDLSVKSLGMCRGEVREVLGGVCIAQLSTRVRHSSAQLSTAQHSIA